MCTFLIAVTEREKITEALRENNYYTFLCSFSFEDL